MRKTLCTLAIAGVALASGLQADGASIGVNFTDGAGRNLATTDVTGAVAQDNWNNTNGSNAGGLTDAMDASGATTTLDVDWSSKNTWRTSAAASDPATDLLYGYLDDGDQTQAGELPTGVKIAVSEVPYAVYDVIVYTSTDFGESSNASLRNSANDTDLAGPIYTAVGGYDPVAGFLEDTAADPASVTVGSNYVKFSGVSESSFVIAGLPRDGVHRGTISGIQLVEVPEPASFALLALGGLAIARRR